MLDALAAHLDAVAALAPLWGYAFILFFMAVESSFIPFPSEIVMIPAGFMAARGELSLGVPGADLVVAIVSGLAGSLIGAYFNYFISATLGEPFLRRYGKWFFVKPEALDRAEELFNRYGGATTFVCRLVPVVRQLISVPAGVSHMPLGKFTLYTGLGAGIWTAILAGVGFWLGRTASGLTYPELVHRGADMVRAHLVWIVAAALAAVLAHLAFTRIMKPKKEAA